MPDINNSLALGIKDDPIDIGKTLLTAGQINALRTRSALEEASTAQTQQQTEYNQFQQDQNEGYRAPDVNTLAEAHQKEMDLRGRVGNMMVNAKTMADRQQAIQAAKDSGKPVDPDTEDHLLKVPLSQFQQYGQNLRRGGMSSESNMVATGETTGNQGQYIPEPIQPNVPYSNRTAVATGTAGAPSQAKVDNAIKTGRNFNGSPRVTSTADITGAAPSPTFNNRYPGADMFTPSVVRGPDGSISSSVTPATTALQARSVVQYQKAGEVAQTAQGLSMRLDMMDHSADVLNSAGWSATGAGANAKLGAAKSVNSLLATVGLPPAIDPTKVANWEDLNKETTRAGFDLARTLGSREAATIVQSSVSAVPGAENTPMGFKLVSSGIRQAIQREKDYYAFATDYAKSHRGNTFGADVEFNKQFPPDLYSKTAVANSIPPQAINLMKSDPKLTSSFDAKYGQGMSGFILHHDQAQ
jgi:hypothetical protein